jgi:hypothetical protein
MSANASTVWQRCSRAFSEVVPSSSTARIPRPSGNSSTVGVWGEMVSARMTVWVAVAFGQLGGDWKGRPRDGAGRPPCAW